MDEREKKFKYIVSRYFRVNGRHNLPWRKTVDPYCIAVSEIMLQQTQVSRVIGKYKEFLQLFPSVRILAASSLSTVLAAWSGLGYNRRAKFLHQMAREVVEKHTGVFPRTIEELESLPGIGHYTARAIATFAYNTPSVFIETNIRTVFIHHFFAGIEEVPDRDIRPIIERTLNQRNPRVWYAALMDYGSYLKAQGIRTHRKSIHYKKQGAFQGSRRQVRGIIVRSLLGGAQSIKNISKTSGFSNDILISVLNDLLHEKIVTKKHFKYVLAGD